MRCFQMSFKNILLCKLWGLVLCISAGFLCGGCSDKDKANKKAESEVSEEQLETLPFEMSDEDYAKQLEKTATNWISFSIKIVDSIPYSEIRIKLTNNINKLLKVHKKFRYHGIKDDEN